MKTGSDLKYWVWFSSLEKITPRRKKLLLDYFKDPAYLWECQEAELKKLRMCTPGVISIITDRQIRRKVPVIMDAIFKCNASVITINDSNYPEALKYIPDPPAVLYCRGELEKDALCVAVVGSRRATGYGLDMAKRLSYDMAKHGVTIVSGMARGIDSKAHLGAIEADGRTIAVLGCGVDIVYPCENCGLMSRIAKSGAVVSEYLPGTQPLPFHFPARNRIISGLSQGVVVVEANERSGSLITADFALDQGRDVFSVPGNINSMNSSGTNRLIREGAKLVTNAGDILDELEVKHPETGKYYGENRLKLHSLGREELTISRRLLEGPAHIDVIARDCGISVQLAGSVLLMLELSGFVEQLPGKYYKIVE